MYKIALRPSASFVNLISIEKVKYAKTLNRIGWKRMWWKCDPCQGNWPRALKCDPCRRNAVKCSECNPCRENAAQAFKRDHCRENYEKYPECDPCQGNAAQVLKYEICRRILSVRRCDLCGQTMVPVDELAPECSECEPSRINWPKPSECKIRQKPTNMIEIQLGTNIGFVTLLETLDRIAKKRMCWEWPDADSCGRNRAWVVRMRAQPYKLA